MLLADIANLLGGELIGDGNVDLQDVAEYEKASPNDLSYVDSAKKFATHSDAGALIVPRGIKADRPSISTPNPRLSFARAVSLFRPPRKFQPGVDDKALYFRYGRPRRWCICGAVRIYCRWRCGGRRFLHRGGCAPRRKRKNRFRVLHTPELCFVR